MERTTRLFGVLVVAAAGVAGCSSDDGHDRADYVVALSATAPGFTESEAECVAEALVDTVGVDSLEDNEVFDKIQDNPDAALADYGIELDDEQSAALMEGVDGCKDLRAYFEDTMVAEGLTPELAGCVIDGIDDATLTRILMLSFVEGDAALDADPALGAAFDQTATDCAAQGIT